MLRLSGRLRVLRLLRETPGYEDEYLALRDQWRAELAEANRGNPFLLAGKDGAA